jgi:GAF domain-containing protein
MSNLSKYRQFSVWAMVILVAGFVLACAACWNAISNPGAKYFGWMIVFIVLMFASGLLLFYVAWQFTDEKKAVAERNEAYESGKASILHELEKRNQQEEQTQKSDQEDIDKAVHQILAGIKSGRSLKTGNKILATLAKNMGFVQGILYIREKSGEMFNPEGEFAITSQKPSPFRQGEGLAGQVAASKLPMVLYDIPEQYFTIESALGSSKPRFLMITPVLFEGECFGVLELAAFIKPDDLTGKILQRLSVELGPLLHTSYAA